MADFWSRVDRSGGDGACWPWLGAKSKFGHGRVKVAGKLYSPHRLAYESVHGIIKPPSHNSGPLAYHGNVVKHECDNPSCCNLLTLPSDHRGRIPVMLRREGGA